MVGYNGVMPSSVIRFLQHHRRIETDAALKSAAHYIHAVETNLPTIGEHEYKEIQELVENPSEDAWLSHEDYEKFHDEITARIEQNYIPALRYSFVTFLHTLYETQLFRVCSVLKEDKNLPIAVSELRGSAIDQVKLFLTRFSEIDVATFSTWATLQDFQKVRDTVTHTNGRVSGSRHEERLKRLKLPGFSIKNDSIDLTVEFAVEYLTVIEKFYGELFNRLGWRPKWHSRAWNDMRGLEESQRGYST